nr:hypothetical protein Iba_chr10dCG5000 [Ipomoea batatas]
MAIMKAITRAGSIPASTTKLKTSSLSNTLVSVFALFVVLANFLDMLATVLPLAPVILQSRLLKDPSILDLKLRRNGEGCDGLLIMNNGVLDIRRITFVSARISFAESVHENKAAAAAMFLGMHLRSAPSATPNHHGGRQPRRPLPPIIVDAKNQPAEVIEHRESVCSMETDAGSLPHRESSRQRTRRRLIVVIVRRASVIGGRRINLGGGRRRRHISFVYLCRTNRQRK